VDGTAIAYLDFGEGEPIVWVPGLIGNIEICWEQELFRRFMLHQAEHARMLPFDKRGVGQSGGVVHLSLEERMFDIAAVLNAAGIERAHLHGVSEGALIAAHFAAAYPDRVQRLVLGNMPGVGREDEYDDRLVRIMEYVSGRMLDDWGRDGAELVHWFIRSQVGSADVEAWAARFARFTASPAMMRRQVESLSQLPQPPLGDIRAPTLVLGTTDDPFVPSAISRRTAELIPGARYAEIEGADHYYFLGPSWRESCDLALEFMLDRSLVARPTSVLATVLFTDLVASTSRARDAGDGAWRETVDSHNRIGREVVAGADGVYVKSTGDGLLAYFSTPSAAILCAHRLATALGAIGLQMRAGLHTGEINRHGDGDLSGIAVNVAARVMSVAGDGEVWISSTVRDLLIGVDVELQDRGEFDLKGIDRRWRLFSCSW